MREDLLFVGFHIHGYASKRKWQIGEEVDAVGISLCEAMEHLHHILSFYQSCIHAARGAVVLLGKILGIDIVGIAMTCQI